MALKQTRRTISLNRAIYVAIMAEAEHRGMSASHFVESLVRKAIRGLPKTEHLTLARAKHAEKARRHSKPLTDRIAKVLAAKPTLAKSAKRVVKHVPVAASITGADPIDQVLAEHPLSLEGLSLVEREHRKRKRSVKVAKKLRERGILTPENEGYASPDSWSAQR